MKGVGKLTGKERHVVSSYPKPEPIDTEQLAQEQVMAMRDEFYRLGRSKQQLYVQYSRLGWSAEDVDGVLFYRKYRWLG